MTMGDHIRTMTNKELSKFIADLFYRTPEHDDKEEFQERMEEVLAEEE
jgi:hypothetical protein